MFCVSCKKEMSDGKRFCPHCGAKQEVQPVAPITEPVQEPLESVIDSVQEEYAPVDEPALPIEETVIPARADSDETVLLMDETRYIPAQEPPAYQPHPPRADEYYPNNNFGGQNGYAMPPQPAAVPPVPPVPHTPPKKKKKSAAPVVIAVILAVFAVIALVFGSIIAVFWDDIGSFFGFGKKETGEEPVCVTYLTPDGLYFAEKDSLDKSVKIDDVRYDKNGVYYLTDSTVVRGNKIFYAQDIEVTGEKNVFSIYMKDIKKNGAPAEVATGVTSGYFAVDSNGEKIVYGKDSVVYYSDLENTYQLASDVVGWCADDNVEKILFLRDDGGTMSLCTADIIENTSVQRFASGITEYHRISDDLSSAVYSKDDELYVYKNGEEKLVANGVEDVYGDGCETFYYVTASEEGVSKSTYFYDDYADRDASITQPDIKDYQVNYYGFVYTSPEYYDALEEYNVKLNRDKVREKAAEIIESKDLFYYDGVSAVEVCKDIDRYNIQADGSRVIFSCYDSVKAKKFNMSDIEYIEDFDTRLKEARDNTVTTYFASGSKITRDMRITNAENVNFTDDAVYYLDDYIYYDESNTAQGDLKKITVASDGTVSSRVIELDVNSYTVWEEEGKIGYYKEENSRYCGKLYVDGVFISDNVFKYGTTYADGKYYVMRNYDYDKEDGELCIIENGETKVVAPSSAGYIMSSDGNMFYITDLVVHADSEYTFSINYYDGNKTTPVAENVESWFVGSDIYKDEDKNTIIYTTGYRSYNNA